MPVLASHIPTARSQRTHHTRTWRVFQIGVLLLNDHKIRTFDKATGKLLWEATLPAAGNATPSTYEVNGRQYLVIGASGREWGAPSASTYVAFVLP